MARLFIFAIGGTGARVLKSLTMLLASGVRPKSDKNYEIVPIIIDPHKANEDLKRTIRLLDNYQSITKEIGFKNGFFSTEITTLNNLGRTEERLSGSFTFDLQQVSNTKFKDYIDFNQLDISNKALADVLFSGTSINKIHEKVNLLDVEMDIGFIGNPNIGSVILNQFKDSDEFKEFASNYNNDDRIFIISSIFGGTGAAGFPTILKNIRDAKNNVNIDGKEFLENSKIGAITVLPYFNIEKDIDSPIQKSDFIAKTKSALAYYRENVTDAINALYYIADDYAGKPYENDPGDNGQKNPAHFIELAAALSVIDFLETPDSELRSENGKAIDPIFKEFGIRKEADKIEFSDFEDFTERKLSLSLSKLELFRRFLDEQLPHSLEKQAWSTSKPELNQQFIDDTFYRTHLSEFLDSFYNWLKEMDDNKRGFAPFNLDSNSDIKTLIKGRKVKSGWFSGIVDYKMIDGKLSKNSKGEHYTSSSQKLINLFNKTTEEVLIKKYGLKN